jgi:hypothetical protein
MLICVLVPLGLSLVYHDARAGAPPGDDDTRRVVILNATDPYPPAFLALDSVRNTHAPTSVDPCWVRRLQSAPFQRVH